MPRTPPARNRAYIRELTKQRIQDKKDKFMDILQARIGAIQLILAELNIRHSALSISYPPSGNSAGRINLALPGTLPDPVLAPTSAHSGIRFSIELSSMEISTPTNPSQSTGTIKTPQGYAMYHRSPTTNQLTVSTSQDGISWSLPIPSKGLPHTTSTKVSIPTSTKDPLASFIKVMTQQLALISI